MSETERIANALTDRTLPKAEWTHHAHLRAGLWHVRRYGASSALTLLRDRIKAFNESVGTLNTDTSGYHETMTQLYVTLIEAFLDGQAPSEPLDTIADRLIANYGDRELPLRYYSRAVLFSAPARCGWIPPDLMALPQRSSSAQS